jgi:lipopolysaccharide transport system ATP-binding protein
MSSEVVIDVRNLSKSYEIYNKPGDRLKQLMLPPMHHAVNRLGGALGLTKQKESTSYFRDFAALENITFQVRRGETVGIIGRNGSGKSTLLQILAGTLTQTSGQVNVLGRVAALLELGSGFNPEFSGRDNVYLNGRILGLTQKEIEGLFDQIVEFAGIGEFIDAPVKTYSSGMFMRLAFAVQAHIDASIVIIDEALAVGDIFFRQKCYARLEQLRSKGAAILLVSHSMPEIEQYCERAVLLNRGRVDFIGSASEASKRYYLLNQGDLASLKVDNTVNAAVEKQNRAAAKKIPRPEASAFLGLTAIPQVTIDNSKCIAIALSTKDGCACNCFQQGEVAVFYYEFELDQIGVVPICGTVIKNEKGTIVHGKNSWQFSDDVGLTVAKKNKVICRHAIELDIAPGEYIFEAGLALVSSADWLERQHISHQDMSEKYVNACQVPNAGTFSVGLEKKNGIPVLRHHGVANLNGDMQIDICS